MKFLRDADGHLFQVGVVDNQPISLKRQATMKGVASRRKAMTTPAEKKMCFALQVVVWYMNGRIRYQRERTVHLADMLSRSLDFYFSAGKVGIEIDGKSHSGELQSAKDKWTDELIFSHDGILILRFSNHTVFTSVHTVVGSIVAAIRNRKGWPYRIRREFDALIKRAATAESWYSLTTEFVTGRGRECQEQAQKRSARINSYVEWFAMSLDQDPDDNGIPPW